MKVGKLFPRKYARGADLNGRPLTVEIERVQIVMMRPNPNAQTEQKGVIYFKNAQKGVILSSRKLAEQIEEIAGTDEMNDWPGTRVTLYPEPMNVAGQARIAIRARAPDNGSNTPPTALQEQEEIIDAPETQTIDPVTGELLENGI